MSLLGLGIGNTVVGNFMAYYLQSVTHVGVGGAGTIVSLALLSGLVTAPFSGRLFDRSGNAKLLLFSSGAMMILGMSMTYFGTVYSAILSGVLAGFVSGAEFTFGFSAARAANKLNPEYETLAVS